MMRYIYDCKSGAVDLLTSPALIWDINMDIDYKMRDLLLDLLGVNRTDSKSDIFTVS